MTITLAGFGWLVGAMLASTASAETAPPGAETATDAPPASNGELATAPTPVPVDGRPTRPEDLGPENLGTIPSVEPATGTEPALTGTGTGTPGQEPQDEGAPPAESFVALGDVVRTTVSVLSVPTGIVVPAPAPATSQDTVPQDSPAQDIAPQDTAAAPWPQETAPDEPPVAPVEVPVVPVPDLVDARDACAATPGTEEPAGQPTTQELGHTDGLHAADVAAPGWTPATTRAATMAAFKHRQAASPRPARLMARGPADAHQQVPRSDPAPVPAPQPGAPCAPTGHGVTVSLGGDGGGGHRGLLAAIIGAREPSSLSISGGDHGHATSSPGRPSGLPDTSPD